MIFKNRRSHEFLLEGSFPSSRLQQMDLRAQPESERLVVGKQFEDETLKRLSEFGEVQVTNYSDDVFKKIDGFITFNDKDPALKAAYPERVSVQIKRRVQGGKDIVFEVLKDFDNIRMGRDRRGVSTLYVVGQQDGKLGIFDNKNIKDNIVEPVVKSSTKILDFYYDNNPSGILKENPSLLEGHREFRKADNGKIVGLVAKSPGSYELRITKGTGERGEGYRKLMMFITFAAGNPIKIIPSS